MPLTDKDKRLELNWPPFNILFLGIVSFYGAVASNKQTSTREKAEIETK